MPTLFQVGFVTFSGERRLPAHPIHINHDVNAYVCFHPKKQKKGLDGLSRFVFETHLSQENGFTNITTLTKNSLFFRNKYVSRIVRLIFSSMSRPSTVPIIKTNSRGVRK